MSLYKRAQILIADLWLCFDGKGLGQFDDIHTLTMFADYRYTWLTSGSVVLFAVSLSLLEDVAKQQ